MNQVGCHLSLVECQKSRGGVVLGECVIFTSLLKACVSSWYHAASEPPPTAYTLSSSSLSPEMNSLELQGLFLPLKLFHFCASLEFLFLWRFGVLWHPPPQKGQGRMDCTLFKKKLEIFSECDFTYDLLSFVIFCFLFSVSSLKKIIQQLHVQVLGVVGPCTSVVSC